MNAPASPEDKLIGVLLMAYGSPESVDELEAYLLDIRGGRPTPKLLVEEIKERYIMIGGRSPLLDITRTEAEKLEEELNRRHFGKGIRFRAYVGMRHWQPRIKEAVAQMAQDQIQEAVALVMAPHSSQLSTGAYFSRLNEAIEELDVHIHYQCIENWYDLPSLIEAITEKAAAAMALFAGELPYVVFTAHSLPMRILQQGDLYDAQLHETARLLAQSLDLADRNWQFCYQSAGQSSEPWLGPSIEQTIVELAGSGVKNILVVPIGFVCDHVEILYDIDIAGRKLAQANGVHLERSESLNASPRFINALADLVIEHLPS